MVPGFHYQRLLRHWRVRLRAKRQPHLSSTNQADKGFALLVVLVVLVALSLMMGAVISATQNYAQTTASRLVMLRLRAALDGGLVTAEHALSSPALQNAQLSKSAETINFGTMAVETRIRPEVAKVDINNTRPELMAQLLRNSGLSPSYSTRIADEIVAGPPDNEAEQESPSNSHTRIKFDTLSELISLKDGSRDLLTCMAPDITVFTHSADVDTSTASARLARALVAFNPAAATQKGLLSAGITSATGGRPDLYEITQTARDKDSQIVLTRQIIIRVTGDPKKPIWILAETSPAPSETAATAACARLKSIGPS